MMPTPHSFASSIAASGIRLGVAAIQRRVKPANKLASWTARSSLPVAASTMTSAIVSGDSRSRIDDRAHACSLAALMLGDVDDRVGSDPHAEQHDTHRHAWFAPVRGGQRSWRAGNRREMHAVLA